MVNEAGQKEKQRHMKCENERFQPIRRRCMAQYDQYNSHAFRNINPLYSFLQHGYLLSDRFAP